MRAAQDRREVMGGKVFLRGMGIANFLGRVRREGRRGFFASKNKIPGCNYGIFAPLCTLSLSPSL
jgi:hypothetical protein